MTGFVASQPRLHLSDRAEEIPVEDGPDAFVVPLKEAVAANISVVNGTSTALQSSVDTEPTATDSASAFESTSASASVFSLESSAVNEAQPSDSTVNAPETTSALSESGASFTPSNSASASIQSPEPTPAPGPAPETSASASAGSNASESTRASRNFAATSSAHSSAEAPAPSTSAASSSAGIGTTFKTDATSISTTTAVVEPSTPESGSVRTITSSEPVRTAIESTETTSDPAPMPTTAVSSQTFSFTPSTSPPTASTERVPATSNSASTPATRNNQVSSNTQPTNTASSIQQSGSSPSPTNEVSSQSGATLRSSEPPVSNPAQSSSPPSAANFAHNTHANPTLQTPQAVTVTSGDSVITTTPAFITSISVSSGKNGSPIQTFTSVFANPTNPTTVPESSTLSDWSFWDNRGAVAGVFITVAVVIISTILGIFYCCRRRRRRRMENTLADSAQFHRFSGPPEMSGRRTTYQPVRARDFVSDDPQRYLMAPSLTSGFSNGYDPTQMRSASQASHNSSDAYHPGALGLTGLPANGLERYRGPFSDYHRYISTGDTRLSTPPGEPVGIAVTSDFTRQADSGGKPEREQGPIPERPRSPSPAPSTPSIYPPSLPTVPEKDEDAYLFYERETRRPDSRLPTPPQRAFINDADPRNPFSSPLDPIYDAIVPRQNLVTLSKAPSHLVTSQDYRPLTPPDSSQGHSPTTPQFFDVAEDCIKPLSVTPFPKNAFLGRPVSTRTEPLPRPQRNPLRLSSSSSMLQQQQQQQQQTRPDTGGSV